MTAPIVNGLKKNVLRNGSIAASELFTAFDDDDAIEYYHVRDFNTQPASGYFTFDGLAISQGVQHKIASTDLSKLRYIAGNQIGFEKIRIIAQDVAGNVSAGLTTATVYSVRPNTTAPFSKAENFHLVANESIAGRAIVKGFDPDGYPIESYSVRDRNNDFGHFELDGIAKPQGVYFTVTADEINQLRYVTSGPTLSEKFDVIAFDGVHNSVVSVGTARTIVNANRPFIGFSAGSIGGLETKAVSDFLSITDADGNTMKKYQFLNTSPHVQHGELVFNGVVQPRKTWISVDANELNQMKFQAANLDFTQKIRVRVNDGRSWSASGTVSISMVFDESGESGGGQPVVKPIFSSNADVVISEQLRNVSLSGLFSKSDVGRDYVTYEIYDPDNDPSRGYIAVSGIPLAGGQVRTLTPEQFANATFVTGAFYNRTVDSIYVRASNRDLWGDWERVDIRTEPEIDDVLVAGPNWNSLLPLNVNGERIITFSFMQQFPNYNTGEAVDGDPLIGEHFSIYSQTARANARRIFRHLENVADVQFIEVADTSTNALGGMGGIVRMGIYGIPSPTSDAAAFAFFPSAAPSGGDIWLNRLNSGSLDLHPGSFGYYTFLHELGHAMGMKHPHDDIPRLPPTTDTSEFSVMSYNFPVLSTTYQLYDISTLQAIYGANEDYHSGNDVYSLFRTWGGDQDFIETIWDGGGIDTLSAVGSTSPAVIDLRSGQASTIGANAANLNIAFGATIEKAIGSRHDDQIIGNEAENYLMGRKGNDYLYGGVGNDFLLGGEGDDVYEFGVNTGFNSILETESGGLDTLKVTAFEGLDLLEDDFRFRLAGNDLVVNLSLNDGDSQGKARIRNQLSPGSQVETLELNGVRIDLLSVASQATSNEQKFRVLTDSSAHGFLVAPV